MMTLLTSARVAMPDHEDVRLFASNIGEEIRYQIADDSTVIRVVLRSWNRVWS